MSLLLYARQNPLDDAKNTFSSWDNCMAKSYCKWPVIVGIVVGSLILFSVIFCVARCICCGAELACCCFKCCTCCCPSGGRSGRSGHKRVKSEPTPVYPPSNSFGANPYAQAHAAAPPPPADARPINQQYRSHAAPGFGAPERPQFATFESPSKSANEDALPAMPSWSDARETHVEVEETAPVKREDVEMDRLNHNGSVTNGSMAGAAAGGMRRSPGPGMGRQPLQRAPTDDSYDYNNPSQAERVPLRGQHPSSDPYARPFPPQDDFRRGSPAQSRPYGANDRFGPLTNQPYGRGSPAPPQGGPRRFSPDPYDGDSTYDAPSRYDTASPYSNAPPPTNRYDARSPPQPQFQRGLAPLSDLPTRYTQLSPYDQPSPPPSSAHVPMPMPSIQTQPTYQPQGYNSPSPPPTTSSPAPAYPGQQTYAADPAESGQGGYRAFSPAQGGGGHGMQRKAVGGSYRDI